MVTRFGDTDIVDSDALVDAIADTDPGDVVTLDVVRGSDPDVITLTSPSANVRSARDVGSDDGAQYYLSPATADAHLSMGDRPMTPMKISITYCLP